MKDLKLSEIWIYPIKSLGGIRLTSARVMPKGLQYDRRFMLIDGENKFLTQRVHPIMALFKTSIINDTLLIKFDNDTLSIPLIPSHDADSTPVQIWDDTVQAHDVGEVYNAWFSRYMKLPCKLVYFPEEYPRPVDPQYAVHH